jgi:hypothetical protein
LAEYVAIELEMEKKAPRKLPPLLELSQDNQTIRKNSSIA